MLARGFDSEVLHQSSQVWMSCETQEFAPLVILTHTEMWEVLPPWQREVSEFSSVYADEGSGPCHFQPLPYFGAHSAQAIPWHTFFPSLSIYCSPTTSFINVTKDGRAWVCNPKLWSGPFFIQGPFFLRMPSGDPLLLYACFSQGPVNRLGLPPSALWCLGLPEFLKGPLLFFLSEHFKYDTVYCNPRDGDFRHLCCMAKWRVWHFR